MILLIINFFSCHDLQVVVNNNKLSPNSRSASQGAVRNGNSELEIIHFNPAINGGATKGNGNLELRKRSFKSNHKCWHTNETGIRS